MKLIKNPFQFCSVLQNFAHFPFRHWKTQSDKTYNELRSTAMFGLIRKQKTKRQIFAILVKVKMKIYPR